MTREKQSGDALLPEENRRSGSASPGRGDDVAARHLSSADLLLAACWAAVAVLAVWIGSGLLDARYLSKGTGDVWFEADVSRVVENMSSRWSNHARASVHPIFGLVALPPVQALMKLLGVTPWVAIRMVLATVAGLWSAGLFAALRLTGCRRLDASAFTWVGMTSAGAVFWFCVPETHTIASLTIVAALVVVALAAHRKVPELVEVFVSAGTLGMTVTNWMAGIAASFSHRSWRRTLQVSINAFFVVVILWLAQKSLTPSASFFLGNPSESEHIRPPEALGPLRTSVSFLIHSMVMPAIAIVDRQGAAEWPIMIVQPSTIGSSGIWGIVASALWIALLLIGTWAALRVDQAQPMRRFLGLFLLGQLALHQLFGNETFLYVGNFLPALILLSALGALTPLRPLVLGLAALLVLTDGVNNVTQWRRANSLLANSESYRHDRDVAVERGPMELRPQRGLFTPMLMPGVRLFDVALLSPGGSFSPGLDLFTAAFLVRDASGRLLLNSDRTPAADEAAAGDTTPSRAHRATPYYDVTWVATGTRRYQMALLLKDSAHVELTIRGAGARPAPVRSLRWNGTRLTINERWVIEPDSASGGTIASVTLADENALNWATSSSSVQEIFVPSGWAVARLTFSRPGRIVLNVRDLSPAAGIDRLLGSLSAQSPTPRLSPSAP